MKKAAINVAAIENVDTPNQEDNMSNNAILEAIETNPVSEMKQLADDQLAASSPQPEVQISSLRHKSSSKKINLLRKALTAGMSREEICFQGRISASVFDRLYFNLCQLDGKFYKVVHKSHFMNGRIQEKGFFTSMDKIGALELDEIFKEGAEIKYSKTEDNKMVIEVIELPTLPDNFDDIEDAENIEASDAQEEIDMTTEEMEYEEEAEGEEDMEAVENEINLDKVGA